MKNIRLCVAALSGTPYLSTIDKNGCMTDNRRELERGEVLKFIHEWSEAEAERTGENTIFITASGKKVLEITVFKKEQT
jgi:hypothetical protein